MDPHLLELNISLMLATVGLSHDATREVVPSVTFTPCFPKTRAGVRVLPARVPVPRRPPSHASPEVRRQPAAQAGLQRRQRGAERDEGRGGTAPTKGEGRGRDGMGGYVGWEV